MELSYIYGNIGTYIGDECQRQDSGVVWISGFGSYGTWLQLMCCASLVVHPYISEYPEVRDGRIWS